MTAYGDGRPGTLHLKHDGGLTSDFWGHITKKDPKSTKPPVITEAHNRIPSAPQKKKQKPEPPAPEPEPEEPEEPEEEVP